MTVINSVGNALTGSTGTGLFVGATSPTLVTPTIGAATATNITFSNYATGGIIGTSTNDSAASTYVGEVITATNSGGTAVSAGAATNVTSISLTAGDWDVFGNVVGTGSVNVTSTYSWISTTSTTLPAIPSYNVVSAAGAGYGVQAPTSRLSLSGTTTVYLGGQIGGSGTLTLYGKIYARRAR